MPASNLRPADKIIVEPSRRLTLEWDAYFSRLEAKIAELAAAVQSGGVPSNRNLTAGAGLTGGGDLSADRTFDVGAGTGITVNVDDVALDTSSTRNTDHAGVTLTAGAGLTGGGNITASRTFDVGAGTGITVNANDVALDTSSTRNTDHTAVTITAGNGLTGGGDISASRTLDVGAGTGIAVNANDVALSHLGIQNLTDPNADRIMFWDDSSGFVDWLTLGTNLSISGTTINATSGGGSGLVLQVLGTDYATNANLTTTIPYDDTTPTSSEGTQILSQAITLASTSSRVEITISCWGSCPNTDDIWSAATFRGTTCINAQATAVSNGVSGPECISYTFIDSPATSGSVTYSVRVGPNSAVNLRMNGNSNARIFGGTAKCTLVLRELAS